MKAPRILGTSATLVAIATACLPSTSDFTKGSPDAGSPPVPIDSGATPAVDAGVVDSGPVDAGPPRSCKDLKLATPLAASGLFTTPLGAIYCDMTTDGGGWTLVARSKSGNSDDAKVPFGWNSTTGDVHDDNHPYSLGVLQLELDFTDIIVGSHDSAKGLANHAYKLAVSRALLLANPNSSFIIPSKTSVLGDCTPSAGPTMLTYAGFSAATDHFHLRDLAALQDGVGDLYGAFWNGFGLTYDDCERGGDLQGNNAEVFVR